jgi:hypothetical protein
MQQNPSNKKQRENTLKLNFQQLIFFIQERRDMLNNNNTFDSSNQTHFMTFYCVRQKRNTLQKNNRGVAQAWK